MHDYKKDFIEFCLENKVIRFGEFTLKSGRISPYFFHDGSFNTGKMIARLGEFYAQAINEANLNFDILFGPAYKGIPLVISTAIALVKDHNIDKPFCFNRKTTKKHGEGGKLIGAPMHGKVLVIDDVITAGTAIREIIPLLEENHAKLGGICIALDRQEQGVGKISAIEEVKQQYNIPVISIITLEDILIYLKNSPEFSQYAEVIDAYRKKYGVSS